MLDLDSLELLQEDGGPIGLYIQFAQWLCLKKISYEQFQKLSKWTNVYEYVLPFRRQMDSDLLDLLFTLHRDDLFFFALLRSHVETNLSPEYQILLLETIRKQADRMTKSTGFP